MTFSVLIEFGSLTQAQLLEKVRALQNLAYQLGIEEGIDRCMIFVAMFDIL